MLNQTNLIEYTNSEIHSKINTLNLKIDSHLLSINNNYLKFIIEINQNKQNIITATQINIDSIMSDIIEMKDKIELLTILKIFNFIKIDRKLAIELLNSCNNFLPEKLTFTDRVVYGFSLLGMIQFQYENYNFDTIEAILNILGNKFKICPKESQIEDYFFNKKELAQTVIKFLRASFPQYFINPLIANTINNKYNYNNSLLTKKLKFKS